MDPTADLDTSVTTLLIRLRNIVTDYRIWILGFYGALMYAPILVFVDLWGVGFLTKLYNIEKATAGSITTMLYQCVGVGSPVVAYISGTIKGRKFPMIFGALISLILSLAIIYTDFSLWTMYVFLFVAGFVFSSQPLIFSSVCQLTPHASNGTAISFINMLVMLLGLILQPFVGWLLDWIWDGVMNNGIPFYTISDYRFALISVPVCLLIALLLTPLIPETFPREGE
jgi:MFS family permease